MRKYFIAFVGTAFFMTVIDLLWIGVFARELYKTGFGHLMAEQPNFLFAALFYLVFPIGLMTFAIIPSESSVGWSKALLLGTMFGFFTYATYDLTNLATLKNWPIGLAFIDLAWGCAISGISAVLGKFILDH